MKKFFIFGGLALATGGVAASIIAARYEPIIPAGTVVGVVPVGGLEPEEAAKRLRLWWDSEKANKISVTCSAIHKTYGSKRWDELGLSVDDIASINQIPLESFGENLQSQIGLNKRELKFPFVIQVDNTKFAPIKAWVDANMPAAGPARVTLVGNKVTRKYESNGLELKLEGVQGLVQDAFVNHAAEIDLPVQEAPKKIPDRELDKIVEPMATFTTNFPTSNRPRCANIKLASAELDGVVLMPHERLSFNDAVGKRTIDRGFQVAGVYVNGRHDTGIGGGICQVSTTLYNASLFANLKIVERTNHSLPVAYVPTGRDATVSWGGPHLVIENNYDFPIAFDSNYVPGRLTFTVLGIKDDSLKVTIERGPVSYRGRATQYVQDSSLGYGKTRVVEPGADRIMVTTYRIVSVDGKVVSRETLGTSVYGGSARIIARNNSARPSPAAPAGPVAPTGPTKPPTGGNPAALPSNPD